MEIGGYFGLEKLISNEYYKDLIALNSGRNALIYLMKAKNIKKLYIPYYLCDSVSNTLDKYEYKYEKYHVDAEFLPVFDKKLNQNEYLYIVNYYGQIDNEMIISLREKYKNIIFDNTHSFFQRPVQGIDTIYSCRKFFGVPDGAYLSTDVFVKDKLHEDISKDRMKHLLGRFEENASNYYMDFQRNDEKFAREPLKLMSKLTHNILGAIDYVEVSKLRNQNFNYLNKKLIEYNSLTLNNPIVAFSYPLYIKSGKNIRQKLLKKKIYIPKLWPDVIEKCNKDSMAYKYSLNILPIPCDQRYGIEDMEYLIDCLVNEI